MADVTLGQLYGWVVGIVAVMTTLVIVYKGIINAIKALTKPIDELKESVEQLKEGTKCSLRETLLRNCNEYIERKYITSNQYTAMEESWKSYNALHGNSFVDGLVKECEQLPKQISR